MGHRGQESRANGPIKRMNNLTIKRDLSLAERDNAATEEQGRALARFFQEPNVLAHGQ